MKRIIANLIFVLLPLMSLGQGFPVKIDKAYYDSLSAIIGRSDLIKEGGAVTASNNYLTIDEIERTEYINNGYSVSGISVVVPTTGTVSITTFNPETPTQIVIGGTLTIQADKKCTVIVTNATGPYLGSAGSVQKFSFPTGGGTVSIPLTRVTSAAYGFQAERGDGTSVTFDIALEGVKLTNDQHYRAKKVILWIGDSVTAGTNFTDPFARDAGNVYSAGTANEHFTFLVRNHFQRRGEDVRLINKAMGSFDAVRMDGWARRGWLDVHQADIIFWQLGLNDAMIPLVSTDAVYTQCINNIIDLRNRRWPKAKLVLVGDNQVNDDTREARVAQLRAIKAAIAAANANNNVYYISLDGLYDRKVLSNYYQTDGTHPNVATNALMADRINSWITANNIKLNDSWVLVIGLLLIVAESARKGCVSSRSIERAKAFSAARRASAERKRYSRNTFGCGLARKGKPQISTSFDLV